jgi:hypothetical protein
VGTDVPQRAGRAAGVVRSMTPTGIEHLFAATVWGAVQIQGAISYDSSEYSKEISKLFIFHVHFFSCFAIRLIGRAYLHVGGVSHLSRVGEIVCIFSRRTMLNEHLLLFNLN